MNIQKLYKENLKGIVNIRRNCTHKYKGTIILKLILKKEGGVDWINLAQYKEKWRTLLSMVINLLVK